MLPDEYRHLEAIASILPDGNTSPVHPFVGLVINLNAVTRAHRDSKDDTMCLVLALGDFEGGDLCLYEPGLVVPLRPGHFIIFPSARITHFNIHYSGCRASIVLHTDGEIDKWTHGQRNGWEDNVYFH